MSITPLKHIFYNENLPSNWEIKTVDTIKSKEKYSCTAGPFGSNISSKYFVEDGIPVIRGGNLSLGQEQFIAKNFVFITEEKARSFPGQHVKSGDLIFTCWGTLGQVALIPKNSPYKEYIISNKQLKLRINNKECNEKYLYYYFSLPQMVRHINDIAIGSAVPGINLGLLKSLKIVCPPLEQQNKIAAVISAYDDLIENNKRRIELLEKMTEEIYREWFVRFRFPGWETAEFEKGIPKGWSVEKIKSIVDRKKFGRIYRDNELKSDGKIVVIDQSKSNYLGFYDGKPEHKASIDVPKILFGDHTCKIVLIHRDFSLAENVIPFTPIEGMPVHFLFHLIKNKAIQTEYKRHWTDLTVQEVLIPPNILQEEFSILVKNNYQLIENLKEVIETLNKSKNLLLPRLISGKLSVEELDIQFPPSMQEDLTVESLKKK